MSDSLFICMYCDSSGGYLSLHALAAGVQQRQQVGQQLAALREVRAPHRAAAQRQQLQHAPVRK